MVLKSLTTPLVVPSTVPVTVLHALSNINNVNIKEIIKLRIIPEFYHNNPIRTTQTLCLVCNNYLEIDLLICSDNIL